MALDAGWDEELLAVEMEELQNLGFDLGLTGFDETEIADLLDTNAGTVKDDDFDLTAALEKLHLYSVAISGQLADTS